MNYGEEAEKIEEMRATFQPIPKHLLNKPVIPKRLLVLLHIFWELNRERSYLTYGTALAIPTSKIEDKLERYGFNSYNIEELKSIITRLDREYREYDYAQLKYRSQKSNGNASDDKG